MHDLTYLRENLESVRVRLAGRGFELNTETFLRFDGERKSLIHEVEDLRQRRNSLSEQIAALMKNKTDATALKAEVKAIGVRAKAIEERLAEVEAGLNSFVSVIPNLPDPSVPAGLTDKENVEVRRFGAAPVFDFDPKAHWDIGMNLGILDLDRAAKITGARFALLAGAGARLERALINFMLDLQTRENGYTEVLPPFMANSKSLFGTGNLPKFEEDLFRVKDTDYYLIPTAEVPVTNIYRDEILDGARLPISYAAYTPCFRSEAGSHGRDVRGVFRQHQFDKVELVKFARPEQSEAGLEQLTRDAEKVLERLGIHYRVVIHAAGDMGFSATKSYDIEVWLPGQNAFREISSCSNFGDFQARRANIRYRPTNTERPRFVHTLNGSGLAIGRTWIAIIENFQQRDGSVRVPEALRPYLDGLSVITPGIRI